MRNIFVFGSNLAGRHGRGSALEAVRNHGAIYGRGVGLQGDSYAIPTKDRHLHILSLDYIHAEILAFLYVARSNPDWTFNVVAIGCGLAGYKPEDIGPLFRGATPNVKLPSEFVPYATP
jgi:hypothetical protein